MAFVFAGLMNVVFFVVKAAMFGFGFAAGVLAALKLADKLR